LMDALELDEVSSDTDTPDLLPPNISREFRKAVVAFSSADCSTVYTPLWGCGAFCGDPAVKMTIIWMAASVAGVGLKILCEARQRNFGLAFEAFAREAVSRDVTALALRQLLGRVPRQLQRVDILGWVTQHLLQKDHDTQFGG